MANASKADGRSKRKARVVPFLSHLDRNCQANLAEMVQLAKKLMTQFPGAVWEDATWAVTGGRLVKQTGKNNKKADLNFAYSPKLGMGDAQPLEAGFAELAKALVTLRFHRKAQAAANQRQFIHALSFVAYVVREGGRTVADITPGDFEEAAHLIGKHYAESTCYQMHKGLGEIAAHLDANSLCKVRLDWKYSKLRRPSSAGGVGMMRLDDPALDDETASDKMVSETVYRLIALLFQRVPSDRRGRMYVLMLTLFACLGRRFSEIAYLPNQVVEEDRDGNAFITYFKRKASHGDTYTPSEKLPLPTEAAPIVAGAIAEARTLCGPARQTAEEMRRVNGPDLRFLDGELASARFYSQDLERLGLSPALLSARKTTGAGWLNANGWAQRGVEYRPGMHRLFAGLEGIKAYCRRDYYPSMIEPVHIDQFGEKFGPFAICVGNR